MNREPSAAILIATCGRPERLEGALSSIFAADLPPELLEILVIENGSCVSESVASRFREKVPIRFIHLDMANKSNALNRGLRETECDLVIFFDDDVVIDPATVSTYVEAARKHGRRHFFGGSTYPIWVGDPDVTWSEFFPLSMREASFDSSSTKRSSHTFLGYNWAAWREEIIEAGGFDSDFGPGSRFGASGQETGAQIRLIRRGCRQVPLDQCRVGHIVESERSSLEWLLERRRRTGIEVGLRNRHRPLRLARRLAARLRSLLIDAARAVARPGSRVARQRVRFDAMEIAGIFRGWRRTPRSDVKSA